MKPRDLPIPRPEKRGDLRKFSVLATVLVLGAFACGEDEGPAGAWTPGGDPIPLGEPEAVFPEDFGFFSSVRELADGSVLLADPLGSALFRVDLEAGARERIGTRGEGPGEYLQPDATWPLPGDSTLVVDLGNTRMVRIGPDLAFGETHSLMLGTGGAMVMALPSAIDGTGRIYTAGMSFGLPEEDSAAIVRIDLTESTADTAGTYVPEKFNVTREAVQGGESVNVSRIPYAPADGWGVAPDGSLVIARWADYAVEWRSPTGETVFGEPVQHAPVAIGDAEKEEYFEANRRGGGLQVARTDNNGVVTTTMRRGGFVSRGGDNEPDYGQYEWPSHKPPFYRGTIPVDSRDRAWVRRHVSPGKGTRYDVFDRQARQIGSYSLEGVREIVGFGSESVYVVAFDDFDLAYLEKYALPGT